MHQNENVFNSRLAWVEFNKIIEIKRRKRKAIKVRAAKYKGKDCSEEIFLVSQGNKIPETNEPYVVFLPIGEYPFTYYNNKSVFSVRTAKPKIINEVIVLRDNLVPRDIFKIKSPDRSKAMILIRDPSEKFSTFLFLIKMECRNNEGKVIRFIGKDLRDKEIKIEKGLIAITIGTLEDSKYLTGNFLNNLSNYISELSET